MSQLKKPLEVFLPDTRGVEISRYGYGNLKIGLGVFTYSRLAGSPAQNSYHAHGGRIVQGTCPGSTDECEAICYAKRIEGPVRDIYVINSERNDVPPIPEPCKILRIHVSGDFDSAAYIRNWIQRLTERPDVTAWAYTRSWRVKQLLPFLEELRALPNMQLFASMDESHTDVPPEGWRRAWIDGDPRAGQPWSVAAHTLVKLGEEGPGWAATDIIGQARNQRTFDGAMSLICPEETKHKQNCLECGYCFEGKRNDVTFLRH